MKVTKNNITKIFDKTRSLYKKSYELRVSTEKLLEQADKIVASQISKDK